MKREVLGRVRSIYYMRTIVRPFFINLGLFVVSIVAISSVISIPSVVVNMARSQSVSNYFSYLLDAFIHTGFSVQIMLAFSLVVAVFLIKDILRNISRSDYTPQEEIAFR